MNQLRRLSFIFLFFIFSLLLISCNTSEPAPPPTIQVLIVTEEPSSDSTEQEVAPEEIQEPESQESKTTGYPEPVSEEPPSDYPAPERDNSADIITESPEIQFGSTDSAKGSIGGILALELLEDGYIPLEPTRLLLADVVLSDQGEPFFIRTNGSSQAAEVFSTGVFIFNNVSPGTYGMMIDLSFTSYPVEGEDGEPLTFTVEADQILDLGELLAPIPTGSN